MKYVYFALIALNSFAVISLLVFGIVWGYIGEYGRMGVDFVFALINYFLIGYWFHRLDRLEEYGRN